MGENGARDAHASDARATGPSARPGVDADVDSSLSPSHPVNLRKQVRLQLDPSFSVKSYIGAAATLLEKAQMADAQGNLESAFVHYLTTASVASFVPKHAEWMEVKQQRGGTFLAYQELMNRTPEIVERAHAIETELKRREEDAATRIATPPAEASPLRPMQLYTDSDTDERTPPPTLECTQAALDELELADARSASSSPRRPLPHVPGRPATAVSTPADSAPSSRPATPLEQGMPEVPGGACLSVEELWTFLFPGFDKTTDTYGREILVKRQGLSVLLVDVRPRADFSAGHIRGADAVCIDPVLLRTPPVASHELEAALQRSAPAAEAACFARRGEYDIVVLYNERTRAFGARGSFTPEQEMLDTLVRAMRDDVAHPPAILRGGMDSWARAVGESGISPASGTARRTSPKDALDAVRQSRQDGYRIPGRRTTADGMGAAAASGSAPGTSRGTVGGAGGLGLTVNTPSMPARAYQNGSANSRDIPSALLSGATGPYEYPSLRSAGAAALTRPPAAAAVPPSGDVHRMPASLVAAPHAHPTPPHAHVARRGAGEVREPRVGLSGLRNFGNTCYMNATLQCLSATVVLARYMLDGSYKKAINLQNPLGTRGALADALAHLLRAMWSQQYAYLSPRAFRDAIGRFAPAFRSGEQQDSQEFLTFLLDGMHEDLNLVQQRPPALELGDAQQAELSRLPQQLASVAEWSMYRRRNNSVIVDAFQGQLRNQLQCLACGHTSVTYNAFMSLSLPIPHGRSVAQTTLLQCVDAFVREEVLEKANAWHCPKCKKARRATKRLSLSRLPPVLLIHLKRFMYKGPLTHKIDTRVTFPTSALDLSNYMPPPLPPGTAVKGIPPSESQQPPYVYDLYGVTHHFGSLTSGHYTASIRTQGDWFYCDDSRITPGNQGQIQSATEATMVRWWRPASGWWRPARGTWLAHTIDRVERQVARSPTISFGVPFVATIVVGSYGLAQLTDTRYVRHDQNVKELSKEETLRLRHDRKKLDIREEYFKMQAKEDELDNWEPKRVARPKGMPEWGGVPDAPPEGREAVDADLSPSSRSSFFARRPHNSVEAEERPEGDADTEPLTSASKRHAPVVLGPDGKPCRACNARVAFGSAMRAQRTKRTPRDACPPDVEELGRGTWTFLHTAAAYYPDEPTAIQRQSMLALLEALPHVYPCSVCAEELREAFAAQAPNERAGAAGSGPDLRVWLCGLHNGVNERLGKPTWDCTDSARLRHRWYEPADDTEC
ncbi:ubiquitinyl hydrolase 1 [Malassezia sp. CBS 17886]|nr:ubiquitinyl hydrolase 1 [Malassezia sp. CBS 17886]